MTSKMQLETLRKKYLLQAECGHNPMITVEKLIQRLEALHEDTNDESLLVTLDILNSMRRNLASRNTLYGYLSDDKWRDLEW